MYGGERVGVVGTLGEKAQEGKVVCAFILPLLLVLLLACVINCMSLGACANTCSTYEEHQANVIAAKEAGILP